MDEDQLRQLIQQQRQLTPGLLTPQDQNADQQPASNDAAAAFLNRQKSSNQQNIADMQAQNQQGLQQLMQANNTIGQPQNNMINAGSQAAAQGIAQQQQNNQQNMSNLIKIASLIWG